MRRIKAAALKGLVISAVLGIVAAHTTVAGGWSWGWVVSWIPSGYQDYTPLAVDQGNANFPFGRDHVRRDQKGGYTAEFENAGTDGGIFHITPLATKSRICNAITWYRDSGFNEWAQAKCWDRAGHAVDTPFVTNYLWGGGLGPLGYVWVDDTADDYFASGSYWYDSAKGSIHIDHVSTGHWQVRMNNLGAFSGNVQVTAYGNTPGTCYVSHWGAAPDQTIDVNCRNRAGSFANLQYNVTYVDHRGLRGGRNDGQWAYLWAEQPTSASYLPFASYRASSSGQGPRVTRSGVGKYVVHLLGITTHGGSAQVTAYGTSKVRCQVSSIPTTGSPQTVGVRCFKYDGTPADARFSFVFTR
jgi:hypothetical protein